MLSILLLLAYLIADGNRHLQTSDMQDIVDDMKSNVEQYLTTSSTTKAKASDVNMKPVIDNLMKTLLKVFLQLLKNSTSYQYPEHSTRDSTKESIESVTRPYEGFSRVSETSNPMLFSSSKGIPGVHFPNFEAIPVTSFTCSDKPHLPGFYPDFDTGCQVFHVCLPDRRESFLCPMGTTFNQALLTCDYWYNSNCPLAPDYYDTNADAILFPEDPDDLESISDSLLEESQSRSTVKPDDALEATSETSESVLSVVSKFIPVKAKVAVYSDVAGKGSKIGASASIDTDNEQAVSKMQPFKKDHISGNEVQIPSPTTKNPQSSNRFCATEIPILPTEREPRIEALKLRINFSRLNEAINELVEFVNNDDSIYRYRYEVRDQVLMATALLSSFKSYFYRPSLSNPMYSFECELYEFDLEMRQFYRDQIDKLIDYYKQKAAAEDAIRFSTLPPPPPRKVLVPVAGRRPSNKLKPRFITKPIKLTPEMKGPEVPTNKTDSAHQ